MTEIGKNNTLEIVKIVDFGVYLDGGEFGEILLPMKWVPENATPNDKIDVFVYFDSKNRIIATTLKPYATVGEAAFLKVKQISSIGSFVDWGLEKDLFVPFSQQHIRLEIGHYYPFYIYFDKISNRIAASTKIDKFVKGNICDLPEKTLVEVFVYEQTNIGYKSLLNNSFNGVLYKNEVFNNVKIGDKLNAYIKKIREDGKVDLTLYKQGFENIEDTIPKFLDILNKNNGFMPITDSTKPEEIYRIFGISKKTFKKIIGNLYKRKIINISNKGIELLKR